MLDAKPYPLAVGLIILVCLTRPALAFGAGNVGTASKVEGQNWRHGDIEDALLTLTFARVMGGKKFNKINVSRTYFGNWLRDYSQAIDVGTVKSVSAEAIRLLLCVLGFLTFGYGSAEFEVTADRLGCYRPEDHIDNPKNYADNEDARRYDRRLRGPVNERVELGIDQESGMKNYIANEGAGIMTSAQHVRRLFTRCIELGRQYGRNNNKADKYEALRLLGTGLHCLEDFFAHSNYTELALIELGERDVFPHVGQRTQMRLHDVRDEVYPLVTGTFGGVDFLHSVTGEVSDKLTQNEIEELEGTLQENKNSDTSMLRSLLDMIPDGIFGGKHQSDRVGEIQNNANAAQIQSMQVSPREPEEYTQYVQQIFQQIMPAIEFHDDVMKSISSAMEKIPVLPKILEQLEEQLSKFVFGIIAPFIIPVIHQIRNELRTGSAEIIESSKREQHIVFHDDRCSDPTHSMLSKDHFTNILNEVAGRTAAGMIHWVVPQIMDCIEDDRADVDRALSRIIYGVMAHPAHRHRGDDGISDGRKLIFRSVESWWRDMGRGQQEDYRRKLSRRGVENGENHKEGVHDTGHGHGCVGKLQMRKQFGEPQTFEDKIAGRAAGAILEGATGAFSGMVEQGTGVKIASYKHPQEQDTQGGEGGFLGVASSLLGGAFNKDETETRTSQRYDNSGSYTQSQKEYGRSGDRYGEAQYSETRYPEGGGRSEYQRYEEDSSQGGRQTYQQSSETYTSYGRKESGGYGGGNEGYGSGRRNEEERRDEEGEGGGGGGIVGDFIDSVKRQAEDTFGGGNRDRGW